MMSWQILQGKLQAASLLMSAWGNTGGRELLGSVAQGVFVRCWLTRSCHQFGQHCKAASRNISNWNVVLKVLYVLSKLSFSKLSTPASNPQRNAWTPRKQLCYKKKDATLKTSKYPCQGVVGRVNKHCLGGKEHWINIDWSHRQKQAMNAIMCWQIALRDCNIHQNRPYCLSVSTLNLGAVSILNLGSLGWNPGDCLM